MLPSIVPTRRKPFLAILSTGILGFGFFFATRSPEEHDLDNEVIGPLWPFFSVFRLALGDFDMAEFSDPLSVFVLLLNLLFSTVLLLNLLIAIMTDSYEQVKESEIVEDRKGRARLVVEHERLWPAENVFPRFMHVLRPAEGGEEEVQPWEGVAGKMKQVEDRLTARLEGLAAENAELEEKLSKHEENLNKKLSEMREELDTKLTTVLQKLEEMRAPKHSR